MTNGLMVNTCTVKLDWRGYVRGERRVIQNSSSALSKEDIFFFLADYSGIRLLHVICFKREQGMDENLHPIIFYEMEFQWYN